MQVTIITPAYNAESYLATCIESILAQTMPDFELLLIDDGSTDSTREICDRYAERDSRIHAYHLTNGGVSRARNFGLDHAQGDFIVFIDADDWIAPEHLEQFLSEEVSHEGIVFSNFTRVWENGRTQSDRIIDQSATGTQQCMDAMIRLFRTNSFGWGWCKMYSRELIETHHIRFSEGCNFAEDEIFTAEYCLYIKQVISHSHPTYFYRITADGLAHRARTAHCKIQDWNYVFLRYDELGYSGEVLYLVLRRYMSRLRTILIKDIDNRDTSLCRDLISVQRAIWRRYRETLHKKYLSEIRDWRFVLMGYLIYTPPSNNWVRLLVKHLHL